MAITTWRNVLLVTAAGLGLAACGAGDSTGNTAVESVSPVTTTTPPAPAPAPTAPANSAPTISGTPVTAIVAGVAYSFQPGAADTDGDALSFSASGLPAWASLNAQTGMLSGTPAQSDVGTTASIVITVSDGKASASLPGFQIAISAPVMVVPPPAAPPATPPTTPPTTPPANTAPTISGSSVTTVQATKPYAFTPSASDAEHQALTFSIANKPSWAAFSSATGMLSGTPTAGQTGTYANIVISVSDGSLGAALPAFSITVTAAPNSAPTISGTPAASVVAAKPYSFVPAAADADHDTLSFSISNKPAWASFDTSTGALTGTPTTGQVGTYMSIVISVSDGKTSTALTAFAITVNQPANSGTANLSWTAPTQNTDGSALTDLAGYRVYHGTSPDALNQMIQVSDPAATTYAFSQLASGTHYFAVTAYTSAGVESALSGVGSKTIM